MAVSTAKQINYLLEQDFSKIQQLGRIRFSCEKVLSYMKRLAQVSVPILAHAFNLTAPTIRSALNQLVKIKVIEEVSDKKRDKVYVYRNYLAMLEEGAAPLLDNL